MAGSIDPEEKSEGSQSWSRPAGQNGSLHSFTPSSQRSASQLGSSRQGSRRSSRQSRAAADSFYLESDHSSLLSSNKSNPSSRQGYSRRSTGIISQHSQSLRQQDLSNSQGDGGSRVAESCKSNSTGTSLHDSFHSESYSGNNQQDAKIDQPDGGNQYSYKDELPAGSANQKDRSVPGSLHFEQDGSSEKGSPTTSIYSDLLYGGSKAESLAKSRHSEQDGVSKPGSQTRSRHSEQDGGFEAGSQSRSRNSEHDGGSKAGSQARSRHSEQDGGSEKESPTTSIYSDILYGGSRAESQARSRHSEQDGGSKAGSQARSRHSERDGGSKAGSQARSRRSEQDRGSEKESSATSIYSDVLYGGSKAGSQARSRHSEQDGGSKAGSQARSHYSEQDGGSKAGSQARSHYSEQDGGSKKESPATSIHSDVLFGGSKAGSQARSRHSEQDEGSKAGSQARSRRSEQGGGSRTESQARSRYSEQDGGSKAGSQARSRHSEQDRGPKAGSQARSLHSEQDRGSRTGSHARSYYSDQDGGSKAGSQARSRYSEQEGGSKAGSQAHQGEHDVPRRSDDQLQNRDSLRDEIVDEAGSRTSSFHYESGLQEPPAPDEKSERSKGSIVSEDRDKVVYKKHSLDTMSNISGFEDFKFDEEEAGSLERSAGDIEIDQEDEVLVPEDGDAAPEGEEEEGSQQSLLIDDNEDEAMSSVDDIQDLHEVNDRAGTAPPFAEIESLIHDDDKEQKLSGEERRLPENSFSFMISSSATKLPFVAALLLILLKLLFLSMLVADLTTSDTSTEENVLGVPASISWPVVTTQVFALSISAVVQDDLAQGLGLLREGYYKDVDFELIQEGFYGDGIGLAFGGVSKNKWMATIFWQCLAGFAGLTATFLLIVTSAEVSELLLTFVIVTFISQLDKAMFVLARNDFLGSNLKEEARTIMITTYQIPTYKKISRLPTRVFLFSFLVLICSWAYFVDRQKRGIYQPQQIVRSGDCGEGKNALVSFLTFDANPEEVKWTLKATDTGREIAKSVGYSPELAFSTVVDGFCVPSDSECLLFTITTPSKDGVCCNYGFGNIVLYLRGELVYNPQESFSSGRQEVYMGTGCPPTKGPTMPPISFPQPTQFPTSSTTVPTSFRQPTPAQQPIPFSLPTQTPASSTIAPTLFPQPAPAQPVTSPTTPAPTRAISTPAPTPTTPAPTRAISTPAPTPIIEVDPTPDPNTPVGLTSLSPSAPPLQPSDSSDIEITITLRLDGRPQETGWYLSRDSNDALVARAEAGKYTAANTIITETALISINENYLFCMTDASGNGMTGGTYSVAYQGWPLTLGDGNFGEEVCHVIEVTDQELKELLNRIRS